jgi:Ser/Thr protein kinase RdoA (MazF antagonist)
MMDVGLMCLSVDQMEPGAVPNLAAQAAQRWEGRASVYVRSSANHIFRFERDAQPAYLRLTPASQRSMPQLEAELAFVQHVGRGGLAVAEPLPSTSGHLIESLEAAGHRYYAVAFAGLRGEHLEVDDLDEPQARVGGGAGAPAHRRADLPSAFSTWHLAR